MNYKLLYIIGLLIFQPLLAATKTPQITQQELKTIIDQGDMLVIEKYLNDMSIKMRYGLEDSQVDFEIFYPLLSQRGFKNHTYRRIINRLIYSEPKRIEEALFKKLDYVPSSAKQRIINFLVKQKYQPIFTYLLEMKNFNSYTFEDFSFVCKALMKFGGVESIEVAKDCIKLPFADERMINNIIAELRYIPNDDDDIPLKFKILKRDVISNITNDLSALAKWQVIIFFTEQKYQQLFTYLVEMKNTNSYPLRNFSLFCKTLVKLGSVESIKLAIDCIKLPFADKYMVQGILKELNKLSTDIPLNFKIIKKNITPYFDYTYIKRLYYTLIGRFKIKDELPFLFEELINDLNNNNNVVLNSLAKFKNKEVFEQTRQIIEKAYQEGRIEQNAYSRLDHNYRFPKRTINGQRLKLIPTKDFIKEQQRIAKIYETVTSLRNGDPKLYVQIYTKYLTTLVNFITKYPNSKTEFFPKISRGYFRLANFIRFSQNKPQQAITFYKKAIDIYYSFNSPVEERFAGSTSIIEVVKMEQDANGQLKIIIKSKEYETSIPIKSSQSNRNLQLNFWNIIGIADIYQYALNKPEEAIEPYEFLLEEIKQLEISNRTKSKVIFTWLKNWLTHEINYLQTGQSFNDEINNEQIKSFMAILYFSSWSC
ncbi:MAG: hypothetical protein QM487_13255 [Candidatus Marithrix sp.]